MSRAATERRLCALVFVVIVWANTIATVLVALSTPRVTAGMPGTLRPHAIMAAVRRKRLALLLLVALVIGVAVAVGLRGRAAESPEKAIYALAEAVDHRDAAEVCQRLFASVLLPHPLAKELRVPEGDPGTPSAWEDERAKCARELGRNGEFDSLGFEDPRVREVKTLPIEPIDGIRRAASARATLGRSDRLQTFKLVDYRGSWKVIFITN